MALRGGNFACKAEREETGSCAYQRVLDTHLHYRSRSQWGVCEVVVLVVVVVFLFNSSVRVLFLFIFSSYFSAWTERREMDKCFYFLNVFSRHGNCFSIIVFWILFPIISFRLLAD